MAFLNNIPTFRFFWFFIEQNLMDSSDISWNKFWDYQLWFILSNHILVTAWPVICRGVSWTLFTNCQILVATLGSYHFLAHGGCGRNRMKDSVKFLIPPGSSRKIVDPPSLFVKISCDPPLKPPPPKVCWVFNDVVLTCTGHSPCQLGVWGCCKVPRAEP